MAIDTQIFVYAATTGDLKFVLEEQIRSLTVRYDRVGGCGPAEFTLAEPFDNYPDIAHDDEIQIWHDVDGTYFRRYTGFVVRPAPSLRGRETVVIRCMGYRAHLSRVTLHGYSETDLGDVAEYVKDIIQFYVAPATGIIYNASKIENVGYAPAWVKFNQSTEDALRWLAEIGGFADFGVDRFKHFFFQPSSTTQGSNRIIGQDIIALEEPEDYEQIKNRLYVKISPDLWKTFEREADFVVDQEQTSHDSSIDTGRTGGGHERIKQTFLPAKSMISQIKVRTGTKQGFTELVTDGDMEAGGVGSWTLIGASTSIEKTNDFSMPGGSQGMKCQATFKGYGFKQALNGGGALGNGQYTAIFKYIVGRGDLKCSIVTAGGTVLEESDRLRKSSVEAGETVSFEVSGGPLVVWIWFTSAKRLASIFYIDDVSCTLIGDGVELWLVDDADPTTNLLSRSSELHVTELPDGSEVTFPVSYDGLETDGSITYAFILKRTGELSPTAYFQFRYYAASNLYADGQLQGYAAAAWGNVNHDLYFQIFYNANIDEYGLREEDVPNPNFAMYVDMQQWADAYLANKAEPVKRATLNVKEDDGMLEWFVPGYQALGLLAIQNRDDVDTQALIEYQIYSITHTLVTSGHLDGSYDLGKVKPSEARFLKQIEHKMTSILNQ